MSEDEKKLRIDLRWVGLGAAVVIFGVAAALALWALSLPGKGQEFVISGGSPQGTLYLPTTLETAEELERINRAGDRVTLARLVLEGKILVVADRTRVVVTDHSWIKSLYQIRMTAGNLTGQSGWVPRQVLAKGQGLGTGD